MDHILWQGRSVRRSTGGRYWHLRGKKKSEIGRAPAETHVGTDRRKLIRTHGGNLKVRALRAEIATVCIPSTGETKRAVIETVEENTANPHYVRRNLLSSGAIIKTDLGHARIVSRPGQDGAINAILLEE